MSDVDSEKEFYGQQEGEVVLYVLEPHETRKWLRGLRAVFLSLLLFALFYALHQATRFDPLEVLIFGSIISLITFLAQMWWIWVSAERSRAIITDRRFIRLEAAFPFFLNKRSLFWNEVLKVKGYAPNLIFRFMKVGVLAIQPQMAEGETVAVPYVYYYEDLANYIDKILYLSKNKPEELKTINKFVPRPPGERF